MEKSRSLRRKSKSDDDSRSAPSQDEPPFLDPPGALAMYQDDIESIGAGDEAPGKPPRLRDTKNDKRRSQEIKPHRYRMEPRGSPEQYEYIREAVLHNDTALTAAGIRYDPSVVNRTDNFGRTYLHLAAGDDFGDLCVLLLENRAQVNCLTKFGNTPLHEAAEVDSEACARLLISHGVRVNHNNSEAETALHVAARAHSNAVMKILAPHADLFDQNEDGQTALALACRINTPQAIQAVQYLTKYVGDDQRESFLSVRDHAGRIPLHEAADAAFVEACRILVDFGYAIDAQDNSGWCSLHFVCDGAVDMKKHMATLVYLAQKCKKEGFDINTQNDNGDTALHLACENGYTSLAQVLIKDANADIAAVNNMRSSPLNSVVLSSKVSPKERIDLVKLLLLSGADPNGSQLNAYNKGDIVGRTPLHYACRFAYVDVAKLLVKHGADPSDNDYELRRTPIHEAAFSKDLATFKFVAEECEQNVLEEDDQGYVPALLAAEVGATEIISYILRCKGGSTGITDNYGNNLLHIACLAKMEETGLYLLKEAHMDPLTCNLNGQPCIALAANAGLDILFDEMMKYKYGLHPFQLVGRSSERVPLVLSLKNAPPKMITRCLDRFRHSTILDPVSENDVVYYDFGLSEDGFMFMHSEEGLDALFQVLTSRIAVVLGAPPMAALIKQLWRHHTQLLVIRSLLIYALLVATYTTAAMLFTFNVEKEGGLDLKYGFGVYPSVQVIGVLLVVLTAFYIVAEAKELIMAAIYDPRIVLFHLKIGQHRRIPIGVPPYFLDPWNVFDWLTYTTLVLSIMSFIRPDPAYDRPLHAVNLLQLWIKALKEFQSVSVIGPMLRIIQRMLMSVMVFVMTSLLIIVAFSLSFYILLDGTVGYENIGAATLSTVYSFLGKYRTDIMDDEAVLLIVFLIYIFLSVLVLRTFLNALMVSRFNKVNQNVENEFAIDRARAIAQYLPRGHGLSDWIRIGIFNAVKKAIPVKDRTEDDENGSLDGSRANWIREMADSMSKSAFSRLVRKALFRKFDRYQNSKRGKVQMLPIQKWGVAQMIRPKSEDPLEARIRVIETHVEEQGALLKRMARTLDRLERHGQGKLLAVSKGISSFGHAHAADLPDDAADRADKASGKKKKAGKRGGDS